MPLNFNQFLWPKNRLFVAQKIFFRRKATVEAQNAAKTQSVHPWILKKAKFSEINCYFIRLFSEGHDCDVNKLNDDQLVAFGGVFLKVTHLTKTKRQNFIEDGGMHRYFRHLENVMQLLPKKTTPLFFPKILHQLYLLDKLDGNVLETIGVRYVADFVIQLLKQMTPADFADGYFMVVNTVAKFQRRLKDKHPNFVDDDNLKCSLTAGFRRIMPGILNGSYFSVDKYNPIGLILDLIRLNVELYNCRNAQEFAKFAIFCFKKQVDLFVGRPNYAFVRSLMDFYTLFQSIKFGPDYSSTDLQRLNESWVNFWIEKAQRALTIKFIDKSYSPDWISTFILFSVQFEKFSLLAERQRLIIDVISTMPDSNKFTILHVLKKAETEMEWGKIPKVLFDIIYTLEQR